MTEPPFNPAPYGDPFKQLATQYGAWLADPEAAQDSIRAALAATPEPPHPLAEIRLSVTFSTGSVVRSRRKITDDALGVERQILQLAEEMINALRDVDAPAAVLSIQDTP